MNVFKEEKKYTRSDIDQLPEGQRAELIDGEIYYMAAPSVVHQRITGHLYRLISDYIDRQGGDSEAFVAPFAVFLDPEDEYNYLEPDLSVICDPNKLANGQGCAGAPDWIIEVVSPSTEKRDLGVKLFKYRSSGVREYWTINPEKRIVSTFTFGKVPEGAVYSFEEKIPVAIYPGFSVCISELL